ncbi:MAG: vitamin B12 dependent-methionine synthase activation domain-containing protein [Chloroflexota bacterium]
MSMANLQTVQMLDPISFHLDRQALAQTLRLREGSPYLRRCLELAGQAEAVARPKAAYRMLYVEDKGDDWVELAGRRLKSRVLRVNLETAERVFFFVATCGVELEDWSSSVDDLLERYWVDVIKEMALGEAVAYLKDHLLRRYHLGGISAMHPGSLDDWPLSAQEDVFALLDDPQALVGVRMTESFLMYPVKSVSGVYFPTMTSFESCQLCPRERCRSRKAPFDAQLFAERYQSAG